MDETRIKWAAGYTLNVGNFQSLRLDCEITDHTRGDETVVEASNRVYKLVEEQLGKKLEEAREALG
jgi:hypothetical protein